MTLCKSLTFLTLLLLHSPVYAIKSKAYGNWIAMDSVDEFTGNQECKVVSAPIDKDEYTLQAITLQVNQRVISDDGEFSYSLGFYIDSEYEHVNIKSPEQALVIIDSEKYDFGSANFIQAAKNGTQMTVRAISEFGIYTKKYQLSGFADAWNDATLRCKQ